MNLTDLQHQLAQTAETTSTLFVFAPVLVMMVPLLLLYFPLRSLRKKTENLGLTPIARWMQFDMLIRSWRFST